uniref:Uncharacterized protein n=1 Tax=Panagrolaimus davidi TaxID=227884 RepID=A0A914QEQ7_9BILA
MRRKLVSAGKNIGFQEIGLLTYYPALYLQAVVEARYIPKDGDIICVLCEDVVVEVIQLPYVDDYYVVFTIDENELYSVKIIYSVIGKWIKNSVETPDNSNVVISDTAKEHFTIPQKPNIKNVEINGIGIDLGTSRCCAAVNRKNKIETVALDNQGQRLLPSYVGFDESKIKCGQLVVDRLRMFEDININSGWPFKIINTGNGVCIEVETATETSRKNPEQIATALLKQIKQKAEAFQGQKLRNVVITVPATFTESQKCATHSAAVLAGWDIVELLPEPVAAVFAYFIDRPIPNNSTFLLFDLGGGTLDVCVFHIANNEIEILSIDGDSQLGGRDFDNVLIDYFLDRLKTEKGINELGDRKYKLIQDCEKIKEDLSAIDKSW